MKANLYLSLEAYGRYGGKACLLAVLLATIARSALAASIDIDTFANPNPRTFYVVPAMGNNSSLALSQQVSGVIGGQRNSLFQVIGPTAANSASGIIGYDTDRSLELLGQNTVGTSPTVTTLTYNGLNDVGLGGIDLTSGGTNDRFLFQFISAEAQPEPDDDGLDIVISIISPSGTSSASITCPNSLTAFTLEIPFSQLSGGASLNSVDTITVKLNSIKTVNNIDFEIHGIAAVPEPAGCFLMAAGGALTCTVELARRKRSRRG